MTHTVITINRAATWQVRQCLCCTAQPFQVWRYQRGEWKLDKFWTELPEGLR